MAIDAIIDDMAVEGANLRLYLRPRVERDMSDSIPGQPELLIINYTWKPERNQAIWGGSGQCIIEPLWGIGTQRHYKRLGYTFLQEAQANDEG
jgi:hypothetical protein